VKVRQNKKEKEKTKCPNGVEWFPLVRKRHPRAGTGSRDEVAKGKARKKPSPTERSPPSRNQKRKYKGGGHTLGQRHPLKPNRRNKREEKFTGEGKKDGVKKKRRKGGERKKKNAKKNPQERKPGPGTKRRSVIMEQNLGGMVPPTGSFPPASLVQSNAEKSPGEGTEKKKKRNRSKRVQEKKNRKK